jgi:hypothetical protein
MTTINIKTVNINIDSEKQRKAELEAISRYLTRPFNPATDGYDVEVEDEHLPKSVRRAIGNLKHCTMG